MKKVKLLFLSLLFFVTAKSFASTIIIYELNGQVHAVIYPGTIDCKTFVPAGGIKVLDCWNERVRITPTDGVDDYSPVNIIKNVQFQIKTDGDIISAVNLVNGNSVDLMSVFQVNGLPPVRFINFYLTPSNLLTIKISTNDLTVDPNAQIIFEQQFQLN